MNQIPDLTISQARSNLYNLVKDVNNGTSHIKLRHRSGEKAVLLSEDTYESLLETMEVMAIPGALEALAESKNPNAEWISHEDLMKEIGYESVQS